MLSYDPPPALRSERAAPIARGLWCWPALLPGVAVVLDAGWPFMPVGELLWIDLAALVCLAWAAHGTRRAGLADWGTPLDGRIAAGFVLALLHIIQSGPGAEPARWLHQIAAAGACYYALAARLRREPLAPDSVWPTFALVVLALATYTLACATQGLEDIARASRLVDDQWGSESGLAKTILLATVVCVGRATERGARPLWRVTAVLGVLAFVLQSVPGGVGLHIGSLASLDEPFYFGTSIVATLFLAGLSRMAWGLAHERPAEAGRWRATSVAFSLVVVLLLLGGTTGGEGVRVFIALAGAATIASSVAPGASARNRTANTVEPPAARAA